MKRSALERHLYEHGCRLEREGSRHSIWFNPRMQLTSSVPRHSEIYPGIARKICKDLGVPPIRLR